MHGQSTDQNNFGKNILGIPVNHASMRGVPQNLKWIPLKSKGFINRCNLVQMRKG